MDESLTSKLDDPDMQAAPRALLRAAIRAREIARQTGTAIVVEIDGELVELRPGDPGFEIELEGGAAGAALRASIAQEIFDGRLERGPQLTDRRPVEADDGRDTQDPADE